jgi:hypothetical protein
MINIYFSLTIHTFIQSYTLSGPSPYLHSCRLSKRNLPGVPSRDSNLGMPYSKPATTIWTTLHPSELRCTLTELLCTPLSYAAPFWATLNPNWETLHPSFLRCILNELLCTLLSYAAPSRATLHSSDLRCTLLSYAAPYWATMHLIGPFKNDRQMRQYYGCTESSCA